MSDAILGAVNAVAKPFKSLVVDRILEYVKFIKSYDDNMSDLLHQLNILCSKKQDIDAKVMGGKARLRVMTRETANWLRSLQELIERDEIKKLMEEDRVVEVAVKMMEQRVLKKLLKDDRESFDIVVQVVRKKCSQVAGDADEDADYKKVAKIVREVMKDSAEEFKKFIKRNDAAIAAVKLLNNVDLEKLKKDDAEMAMILSKAEGISRKELEHTDHGEEELVLKKHDEDVQRADKNIIKEKAGIWRKHMGSLMGFMDDENFKKSLPDGVKLGLEVMDALSKSSGFEQIGDNAKQHRCCGCCVVRFNGYRHRHDMSETAEIMVKEIKTFLNECPPDPVTRPKRADELENISCEFMEGLESREELLQKILTALRYDQVSVVGVFGMGGAGKTTLAKEVANKRASDLFDKRVVVEVSEVPNIKGIQDQIAEGINLPLDDVHTVTQRALKLYNGLKSEKKQKILIILDNVWKKLKLEEVGIPSERTKDFCCKLLITTREKHVCRDMDVEDANIFEVGVLNDREALNLFENQTGKKEESGGYKSVIDRLLRKCGGLPLAIVATASALRGKDLSTWLRFAEESEKPISSSQVSSEYRETYSILETSYKLMENKEKKKFFFLACLSPLDSAVSIDDLIRYGIGLDLFQRVNSLTEAMDQASRWANELVSSSLLLNDATDGQVKRLKIHDVVRASAISFVEKDKDRMILVESIPRWMCKDTFEKFTAISLLSGHDFSRLSGVKAPLLQILLLKGDISSTTLTSNFFRGMRNLKVLSLSNIDFKLGLPKSMGQLKRLKTLHLQHSKLKDIKLIGNLVNLLVLSLCGSTLEKLPDEIGELCNLRLLDMGGCKGKISIPANILSRLSLLEGLYMSNGFNDWASMKIEADDEGADNKASVSELNKLSHLNVLEMEVLEPEQLLTLNDGQLVEQLSSFKIHVGDFANWYLGKVYAFRRVLELNRIDASQNKCIRALLKKSDCLQVRRSGSLTENFVPQLDEEGFKGLKHFEVGYCNDYKCIISSNNQDKSLAFENLEILKMSNLLNLEVICDWKAPAGLFSNLRSLTLYELPKLKYGLPLVPLNLVEVSIKWCKSLKFIFVENVYVPTEEEKAAAKKETDIIELPRLESIELSFVESLSSVLGRAETSDDGAQAGKPFFHEKIAFPTLQSLKLCFNGTIVTLWSKACHVSSFQNLKIMDMHQCKELQSLGSPSLFAALVQLEELKIYGCEKLQEVITKETEGHEVREHVIVFPLLKRLFMDQLSNLKTFYGGSYKLEFPILKQLTLSNMRRLTNFFGSENSTALFSDKIEFPCLEELAVESVSDEVVRLWNWSSSGAQGENVNGNVSLNPFPNLQQLRLGKTRGLTSIPPFVSHNLSHLEVVNYYDTKSLFSTSLENEGVFWTYSQLPKLENLSVKGCHDMEELFENEVDAAALRLCGQLTRIMLEDMPKLKMIPQHMLKNLRSLNLHRLRWKYLFSADLFIRGQEQLQLLESLKISYCDDMEVMIMDKLVGDGEDRVYVFPRLKIFTLSSLPNITNFAYKPNTALQFSSLERVDLSVCPKFQSFCSGPFGAPKLKQVWLRRCDKMQFFLSENMNDIQKLPSLESVQILQCLKLLSFSCKPIAAPKLRQVILVDCPKMKWFSHGDPNHDDILELPSLESVSINNCSSMQLFSPGQIKAPKLSQLRVDFNDYFKLSNEEPQHLLQNLHKCTTREEDEDVNRKGDEGMEELQTEGSERSQVKQITEGDSSSIQ